ncbi:MAG: amino acid permease [Methanoregula sp.]|nr:amino acid permease [Methanoregula sp.]
MTSIFNHTMFSKKPMAPPGGATKDTPSLKRVLKPVDLVMLGVGGIIGTGIFVLSGVAAGLHAGNALPLSFIIAGTVCLFAALCYAEFSTMIPVAGSAYTYSYTALGEVWAWIIGWTLILEYGLAISAVAIGWSGYMHALVTVAGINLPSSLIQPYGVDGGILNLPAVLIVLALTLLLVKGTKESVRMNTVIVVIKIAVILLFILLSVTAINPGNWEPLLPPNGWFGVFSGAAVVFFAFIGFDAVVTAAEEIEEPQKSLPIGLIGSLIVCMILYIIVGVVLTGVVPFAELARPEAIDAPIAYALSSIGISWGAAIVSFGALAGMTSVMLVMLFGQSRIFFAMSRDGLLPTFFSKVNPVTHTPAKSILFIGIITACVAGLFPLATVAELVNMGTLVAFSIVALGVLVLRHQQPELKRPFRCPLVPYVPVLCIGTCGFLILNLKPLAHIMFVAWLCIGLVVYFLYGVRHSENRMEIMNREPHPVSGHAAVDSPAPYLTEINVLSVVVADPDK